MISLAVVILACPTPADEPKPDKTPADFVAVVVPSKRVVVTSRIPGRVAEVLVEEGQKVKKGDVIARLERDEHEINLRKAEALLEVAKVRLEQTATLPTPDEKRRADADLLEAEKALQPAQREFDRQEKIRQINVKADQTEYRKALEVLTVQQRRVRDLQTVAHQPVRTDTAVKLARAEVAVAEAELARARLMLASTDIHATSDGTVTSLQVEAGSYTNPSQFGVVRAGHIAELADFTRLEVEAAIPEAAVGEVAVGQRCEVRLTSAPKVIYRGEVTRLLGIINRVELAYGVRIKLEVPANDMNLRPEMTARVRFISK
jgi:multidrug efflux pump subunit AcrA (membrane-fusion protein)